MTITISANQAFFGSNPLQGWEFIASGSLTNASTSTITFTSTSAVIVFVEGKSAYTSETYIGVRPEPTIAGQTWETGEVWASGSSTISLSAVPRYNSDYIEVRLIASNNTVNDMLIIRTGFGTVIRNFTAYYNTPGYQPISVHTRFSSTSYSYYPSMITGVTIRAPDGASSYVRYQIFVLR